jgi:hypothetical protein
MQGLGACGCQPIQRDARPCCSSALEWLHLPKSSAKAVIHAGPWRVVMLVPFRFCSSETSLAGTREQVTLCQRRWLCRRRRPPRRRPRRLRSRRRCRCAAIPNHTVIWNGCVEDQQHQLAKNCRPQADDPKAKEELHQARQDSSHMISYWYKASARFTGFSFHHLGDGAEAPAADILGVARKMYQAKDADLSALRGLLRDAVQKLDEHHLVQRWARLGIDPFSLANTGHFFCECRKVAFNGDHDYTPRPGYRALWDQVLEKEAAVPDVLAAIIVTQTLVHNSYVWTSMENAYDKDTILRRAAQGDYIMNHGMQQGTLSMLKKHSTSDKVPQMVCDYLDFMRPKLRMVCDMLLVCETAMDVIAILEKILDLPHMRAVHCLLQL